MRCFMRAENEGLTVGSVQINVLEVRHDSVRLGIHDPRANPSYREEVLYIQSDDDQDEDDHEEEQQDLAFEPFQFEEVSFLALPVR